MSVREFYEAHPYPPPVDDLDRYRDLSGDDERRRVDHFLHRPAEPFRDCPRILIAGCGTSQAVRHALRWPHAAVTGIDFSERSIHYSEQLKSKYQLVNLELRQMSIEQAAALEQHFDHVVCTGVLHHLPDPDRGLRALRSVLAPGAAMHLMVYAPYGRAGIYMLADYCRRLGVRATSAEIRDLAATLSALPSGHPLEHLLRSAPDFRTEAGLADALLNPLDRAYSVPQLVEFIESNGCRLARFVRQAPYLPHCGALAATPHAARLAALPLHEQHAAVELFRGTMVRHSAIVRRDDDPVEHPICFDDESWRRYVPLRLPETRTIEERLPPGAVAVLLNPSHAFTDIYLPIDGVERRLLDAIDGRRDIDAIARVAAESGRERARDFFERLWRHDQVVFDASRTAESQAADDTTRRNRRP